MAKTQIGAVIGVEGAKEYKTQIQNCVIATKQLASATSLVEASFKNETKTLADVTRLKTALKGEIIATSEKLALQRAELSKVVEEYKKGGESNEKLRNEMYKLATETNKTETELYNLEKRLNDLPAENFVGKMQLIKENLENNRSSLKKLGDDLQNIGKKFTTFFTLPYVAGVGASIKATTDWETAFTGVKKTNDEIIDSNGNVVYSYEELEKELQEVGLVTGSTLSEIGRVAEIIGQLGFATDVVGEATEYIIQLAGSTNLAAEEGASYIATILNLMNKGLPVTAEQVKQLGSAMVYLGNNYNTTESDIASMAARLAPAAAQLNFTTADVLALAAALSEAKITAEGGGTAMTQVLTNITKQMANYRVGAESTMDRISQIAGMSAEAFADTWEKEPIIALDNFITGLSKLDETGEYTSIVFDELGMSGIRQALSLNALAVTHEHLSKAISDSNREYLEATALSEEYSKREQTLEVQIQELKNALVILGDSIGKMFVPFLKEVVEGITQFMTTLKELPDWVKQFALVFGGVIALVGPALIMAGKILVGLSQLKIIATTLGVTLGALAGTIGTVIASVLGVAAAIAGVVVVIRNWDSISAFLSNLFENIKSLVSNVVSTVWELIKSGVSAIWEWIKGIGISILEGMLSFVERIVSRLILFFTVDLRNFINGIREKINEAKQKFIDMKQSIINTIGSMAAGIASGVINIRNNLINGLRSAFDWVRDKVASAWTWGSDLVKNMAAGIRSAISSVTSAVRSVANKISSFLHFSEPDIGPLSNFHTWMPDMMKGLAKGIDDNLYMVENASSRVAEALSGSNTTNNNYGGVNIYLNVPQGANGQQIVSEIENELANRSIRRKVVFG